MQDSNVIVLANLKPRNMRGIKSNGMLMCASDASHETVELLTPPEGSVPGERVWFGSEDDKSLQSEPATGNQVSLRQMYLHCDNTYYFS
jgi:tRNA-binding EMAP/Myf-like protein